MFRTIWSTISSTLHHTPSSSTSTEQQQPPGVVPPPHPSVGPVASTSTSATDEPSSSFEFYDPRGLATKVRRSTRSRSNTPQVEETKTETESGGNDGNNQSNKVQPFVVSSPGNTFGGRRGSSAEGSVIDSEGDTRMRIGSEVKIFLSLSHMEKKASLTPIFPRVHCIGTSSCFFFESLLLKWWNSNP